MSQHTLPCTPPQKKTVEGGLFFSYRCLVFPKNVFKEKPVLIGDILVKRPKNVILSIFTQTIF